MSRKFWAENRETGERWKPSKEYHEYLVMYDSGYLAEVSDMGWDGVRIRPLNTSIWKVCEHN